MPVIPIFLSSHLDILASLIIANTASMESYGQTVDVLRVLHYIFPTIILAYYLVAQSVSICTLQSLRCSGRQTNRKPILVLQVTVLALYAIEASMLTLDTLLNNASNSSRDSNVSNL